MPIHHLGKLKQFMIHVAVKNTAAKTYLRQVTTIMKLDIFDTVSVEKNNYQAMDTGCGYDCNYFELHKIG